MKTEEVGSSSEAIAMATESSNKRRKTSSRNAAGCLITDIPDALLVHVAHYLARPSRVLFAVALDNSLTTASPHDNWLPTATSKAIISASDDGGAACQNKNIERVWSVLDFGEIEKGLAAKITDDHLSKMLMCIDAPNHLEVLKLAGCVNITGMGLEPLRGSIVLKGIDLSLAGKHDRPIFVPDPQISQDLIIPLLDSIIGANECSLKLMVLPNKFRNNRNDVLNQFIQRYNQRLGGQGYKCTKCTLSCLGTGDLYGWCNTRGEHYGQPNYTCYQCMTFYCYRGNCSWNDEHSRSLNYCLKCEKEYCQGCVPSESASEMCKECSETSCGYCGDYGCEGGVVCGTCERLTCIDCLKTCAVCDLTRCNGCEMHCPCQGCSKVFCVECITTCNSNNEEANVLTKCSDNHVLCSECRYAECSRDWVEACSGCCKNLAAFSMPNLRKDNENLRSENDRLRTENKELRERLNGHGV